MLAGAVKRLKRAFSLAGQRVGVAVVGLVVVLLVLLVVLDVILRRFFNSPLPFSYEMVRLAFLVIVWCSVLYSTVLERHISIDLLVSRFPAASKKITGAIIDFFGAAVIGVIAWQCIVLAMLYWKIHYQTETLAIPYYPFVIFMALVSIISCLALLVELINSLIAQVER